MYDWLFVEMVECINEGNRTSNYTSLFCLWLDYFQFKKVGMKIAGGA